uniref:Sedoheptulokinase putative n=1 Tax=Albugo laibachii Nc14 TaxID=890382 RepID=F0WEK7_9STRA|nr:sedoheptulokinase putative [Albugo laibachii Nc14]|eukprot:CCA19639.1 sedoheptulokinase putative [Albugo laibachii Nc14]
MTVVAAPSVPKQHQRSYKIREKIAAIKAACEVGEWEAAKQCSVPCRTLRDWLAKASEYDGFDGNLKKTTIGGQGRHELMPFAQELVTFMKDRRRNDKILATRQMIVFIKANHFKWFQIYLKDKKSEESGYAALMNLCQRLAVRHGFLQKTASETKQRSIELKGVKRVFISKYINNTVIRICQ